MTHYNFTDASCTEHIVCCQNIEYRIKSLPTLTNDVAINMNANNDPRFNDQMFFQKDYFVLQNNALGTELNWFEMYTADVEVYSFYLYA